MRNTMMLAALATTATLLLPAKAAAQFEGVITIDIHENQGGEMTMVQWTMPNRFRMDMNRVSKDDDGPGSATMIVNRDSKTLTMVMPAQHMYMTTPLVAPKTPAPEQNGKSDDDLGTLTRTGRTETVAGVTCDVYHGVRTVRGKQEAGDVCFAKGVGFMPGYLAGAGPMGQGMEARFARIGAPPDAGIMKVTSDVNGKPHVDLEVTKVDKRSLSASDFQPPAGYKAFQAPGH